MTKTRTQKPTAPKTWITRDRLLANKTQKVLQIQFQPYGTKIMLWTVIQGCTLHRALLLFLVVIDRDSKTLCSVTRWHKGLVAKVETKRKG